MPSFGKWLASGSAVALAGVVGFGYTNPSWTTRTFHTNKCPQLMYDSVPSREMCARQLSSYNTPDNALDVLVVGGGCVGTGTALDAVTRGLRVGLVEMNDYASETSSRSTKLIHGGIRYLEKAVFQLDPMQLKLVAEALRERAIMIHQAPHLCTGLPTLIPCYRAYDLFLFWCGTKTYDIIASLYGGTIQYSGFVGPNETMKVFPALRTRNEKDKRLLGAVRYYDGQMNDARLCFSVAMTAASYGAATVNYAKVTDMEPVRTKTGEEVVKVTVEDRVCNKKMVVFSKSIVNAGGPFAGEIENLAKTETPQLKMIPAAGTHVIIDRRYCPKNHEAMVAPSSDGRVVFAIPWLGGCLLGTTDHLCDVSHNPQPPKADVDFLLKNVEPFLGKVPLSDVKSTWAGIRPLAAPASQLNKGGGTQNIVREHMITIDDPNRILSITGGKWTTYRKMAEDVVDHLRDTLMKERAHFKPCCTDEIVMVGAKDLARVPLLPEANSGIADDIHRHWRSTYGDRYFEVSKIAHQDNHKYMKRLHPDAPVTEAEVLWSANNEHCEHVEDFIARRTRSAFVNAEMAESMIPRVAELMAQAKGWSRGKANAEKANAFTYMASFKSK